MQLIYVVCEGRAKARLFLLAKSHKKNTTRYEWCFGYN